MTILERYKKDKTIRALIQLIPFGIGSGIDIVLMQKLENVKEERARTFFDELAQSNSTLDQSVLESEDFLHAYFSTAKYAFNTRRREKIKMFARLLKGCLNTDIFTDINEYEDYLNILDELSYRELVALNLLDQHCKEHETVHYSKLQLTGKSWTKYIVGISNELKIDINQVNDFLIRISRTGCIVMNTGTFVDEDIGKGQLTATYLKLKNIIYQSSA